MTNPQEIMKHYNDGIITFMEMSNMFQDIMDETNISEIMTLIVGMRNQNRAFEFMEQVLGLLGAIDRGEPILRWNAPSLTPEECKTLRNRLSCIIKYMDGEL